MVSPVGFSFNQLYCLEKTCFVVDESLTGFTSLQLRAGPSRLWAGRDVYPRGADFL
jgi:hypothetical protein